MLLDPPPPMAERIVLAALYLRGAPRPHDPPRGRWATVAAELRARNCPVGRAAEGLRAAGLWSEAIALETPGLLDWAAALIESNSACTAACPDYPRRWLSVFGAAAPPALYCRGQIPPGPFLGVVGSRHIDPHTREFARRVGLAAESAGFCVVSGGASGCDRAAVSSCRAALVILPCGLEARGEPNSFARYENRVCLLSCRAPAEPFCTMAAMERNALIYAASEHTVVVKARFKQGGTWTGAADAARRRLTRLLVRENPADPAHRALIAMGAVPLASPEGLAEALSAPEAQQRLFNA